MSEKNLGDKIGRVAINYVTHRVEKMIGEPIDAAIGEFEEIFNNARDIYNSKEISLGEKSHAYLSLTEKALFDKEHKLPGLAIQAVASVVGGPKFNVGNVMGFFRAWHNLKNPETETRGGVELAMVIIPIIPTTPAHILCEKFIPDDKIPTYVKQ